MDDVAAAAWARGTIRAEMLKRGMNFSDLARELRYRGFDDTEKNLSNKIARGTFSAAFFFQCMEAIGVAVLHLDFLEIVSSVMAKRITLETSRRGLDAETFEEFKEELAEIQGVLDASEMAKRGE